MVSKKAKVIFLMPPKTASNSIKECLLDSSIDFLDFNREYKKPKIHLYLSELVELFQIEDLHNYKVIQVVREPLNRFVSSYFHQLKIIKNIKYDVKLQGMSFTEFTKHFYACLFNKNFLNNFYGNPKFIYSNINAGTSWGGSRLYLSQSQWNDLSADITYIKLEDISKDISILSKELGVYLPQLEKKNTNTISYDKYDQYLTKETNDIIRYVYEEDFINFKY
jgi:hypothetical protein